MTIFPAIDLFEGKAVRLMQGDYEQMTVYHDNPLDAAWAFKEAGAKAIHIVDLEGARNGVPANFEIVERIAHETGLEIQIGGGIRSVDIVEKYLNVGVKRVILGTAAVSSPIFLENMVRMYSNSIAVSADMRDGLVAINGWTELSNLNLYDFSRSLEGFGVQTLICTDISKDGLLGGTNMDLYRTLREMMSIRLIASGGITTVEEISTLAELRMDGAILGKALYTGSIKLEDAISAATGIQ
jgi:phosphoribosylformimino-5-aminoimidazole carboxamide ribotide isomerase